VPPATPHHRRVLASFTVLAAGVCLLPACASTPIAEAAVRGNAPQVQTLLAQGANPEGADDKSRRALELAVVKNRVDVVPLLIAGGADLNYIGVYKKGPLHLAAVKGFDPIVRMLIEGGADVNLRNRWSQTPLIEAVAAGKTGSAVILIEAGADLNATDRRGQTALHLAVQRNRLPIVQRLIQAGANPDIQDGRRLTARDYAVRSKHPSLIVAMAATPGTAPLAQATAPTPGVRPLSNSPPPRPPPAPAVLPPPLPPPRRARLAPAPPPTLEEPIPSDIEFGGYHALVIGNNGYRHLPKLRTAIGDAMAVSQLLSQRYDFEVTTLTDATREDILLALSRYRRNLGPEDNLLIYYAGHGWLDQEADQGYWLPIDARQDDPVNWVSNSAVTSSVRAIQAKHVLVVADSCYSGKMTRGLHIKRKNPSYLSRIAGKRARVVLTSGGIEPVMDAGGRDDHSVFASAFIDALAQNTTVLEGHELYMAVKRPVGLNSDQLPEYSDMRKAGHDGGDFLFVPRR
jgi:hypothetical protein